jgi:hypothetical protein
VPRLAFNDDALNAVSDLLTALDLLAKCGVILPKGRMKLTSTLGNLVIDRLDDQGRIHVAHTT